jgi:anti-anti-sigma regulatory factor
MNMTLMVGGVSAIPSSCDRKSQETSALDSMRERQSAATPREVDSPGIHFGGAKMSLATAILEAEQQSEILVLKPATELHYLEDSQIEEARSDLLDLMDHTDVRDMILDLSGTEAVDSPTIRLSIELWNLARSHGGNMGICFI